MPNRTDDREFNDDIIDAGHDLIQYILDAVNDHHTIDVIHLYLYAARFVHKLDSDINPNDFEHVWSRVNDT